MLIFFLFFFFFSFSFFFKVFLCFYKNNDSETKTFVQVIKLCSLSVKTAAVSYFGSRCFGAEIDKHFKMYYHEPQVPNICRGYITLILKEFYNVPRRCFFNDIRHVHTKSAYEIDILTRTLPLCKH